MLASHLLDAYRLDPNAPDAGGAADKGPGALSPAGERATSLAAAAEAERYFEQACELAAESRRRPRADRAGEMAKQRGP